MEPLKDPECLEGRDLFDAPFLLYVGFIGFINPFAPSNNMLFRLAAFNNTVFFHAPALVLQYVFSPQIAFDGYCCAATTSKTNAIRFQH